MITCNGCFEMSLIGMRITEEQFNGLDRCNFQVVEQICETIKACSINRKLYNLIDIVNT